MDASVKQTTDHDEVRRWAESLGGKPHLFDNPRAGSDRVGIRIDFPGFADDEDLPHGSPPRDIG